MKGPLQSPGWKPWLEAAVLITVLTVLFVVLDTVLGLHPLRENLDELYILAVVVVATRGGPGPAVLASILSLAFWRYLMIPYYDKPAFSHFQMLVSLPVFMVVALLAGQVTAGGRRRELEARSRERETSALYDLSLAVTSETDRDALFELLSQRLVEVSPVRYCAFWLEGPPGDGWGRVTGAGVPGTVELDASLIHKVTVGQNDPVRYQGILLVPLRVEHAVVGCMEVHPLHADRDLTLAEARMVMAVANHANLFLLRQALNHRAAEALANLEAERLKASLLSSVSHDLRTPLSSIKAFATSLVSPGSRTDEETRQSMLHGIVASADRLNAFIANLLDMSRLEAGAWQPLRETYPVEEILTGVLSRLSDEQADRVKVTVSPGLPLVHVDGLQVEQTMWNLVENALKYSPPASEVDLTILRERDSLKVTVRDHGSGVPAGHEADIFRKFYRVKMEGGPPGLGVGLSICKAAVEAHGGRIYVENVEDGGACFAFVLPAVFEDALDQPGGGHDPTVPAGAGRDE